MKQLSILLGLAITISIAPLGMTQEIDYSDSFNEPMALFDKAMGDFHFPISSSNKLSQT